LRIDLPNIPSLGSRYHTLYYVSGDLQEGHGLRGAGGASSFVDGDRGIEELGDAVFFFLAQQREVSTGSIVAPLVGQAPRPDRIIRPEDGQVFTVLRVLDQRIGSAPLFQAIVLGLGVQGAAAMSIPE